MWVTDCIFRARGTKYVYIYSIMVYQNMITLYWKEVILLAHPGLTDIRSAVLLKQRDHVMFHHYMSQYLANTFCPDVKW